MLPIAYKEHIYLVELGLSRNFMGFESGHLPLFKNCGIVIFFKAYFLFLTGLGAKELNGTLGIGYPGYRIYLPSSTYLKLF